MLKKIMIFLFAIMMPIMIRATPTTQLWTACSMDIQPFGVWHIGVDNYMTVGPTVADGAGALPVDAGITVGVLPFKKINMEIGFDLVEPTDTPLYLNAKIGTPEGAFFEGSPGFALGIYNMGFVNNADYNIGYFVLGKSLPLNMGRLHAGYYIGNAKLLINSSGLVDNQGWMLSYDKYIVSDKLMLLMDYASGDNALEAAVSDCVIVFQKMLL